MASTLVIETLTAKRQQLVTERDAAVFRYDKEISDIETALMELAGKKVWETQPSERYDDENPEYIKGSIEEL